MISGASLWEIVFAVIAVVFAIWITWRGFLTRRYNRAVAARFNEIVNDTNGS